MGFVNPISLKGPAEMTHGWMLVGLALNILLMGVMIAQIYMYYTQYRDDTWWLKAMVAAVFLLDIINTAFLFTYIYRSLITFFGDVQFLAQVDWTLATGAWTTGVIAAIVQLFFAWRIFVLTRNWVYVVVIGSLALAGCGASIAVPVKTGLSFPVSRIHEVKPAVTVWLASDVAADIIITTVLVWYLVSQVLHKHKSGFKRSDMVVDRVIRFTLQTGLLTVVFASIDLFFFLFDVTHGNTLPIQFPAIQALFQLAYEQPELPSWLEIWRYLFWCCV
ncbi:hypothetical protein NLJ89_g6048 [Agrocybe chaxingu]|uniref:DUF6534 domain-containing protein n=1 Tax=Agrocybe chaxingu TaxID=84603 RepID=A0A9W8JZX0_9AGAR|nr:hypothetical protein NLJ89_g6048 [Agrocybe chaxingu]